MGLKHGMSDKALVIFQVVSIGLCQEVICHGWFVIVGMFHDVVLHGVGTLKRSKAMSRMHVMLRG